MIPGHEKRILEAFVRGIAFRDLALATNPLSNLQKSELQDLIQKRSQGIPLQHIVGTQDFCGREFIVSPDVLIPRPETEGLVELALSKIEQGKALSVLDFGTGSGCIAITLALEFPSVRVVASDCCPNALNIALQNTIRLMDPNKIELREVSNPPQISDYDFAKEFDVIIGNPPYLINEDQIPSEVYDYEPKFALLSEDAQGLSYYKFLADLVHRKLSSSGFAVFEIAENRGIQTEKVFTAFGLKCKIFQDLTKRDRYILVNK